MDSRIINLMVENLNRNQRLVELLNNIDNELVDIIEIRERDPNTDVSTLIANIRNQIRQTREGLDRVNNFTERFLR